MVAKNTNYLTSEILLASRPLVSNDAIRQIAATLRNKGAALIEKDRHLAFLYPSSYQLDSPWECGYLWREVHDWHFAIAAPRWWMLFGRTNKGRDDYEKLLDDINATLEELDLVVQHLPKTPPTEPGGVRTFVAKAAGITQPQSCPESD
jgi:hypothetical protein